MINNVSGNYSVVERSGSSVKGKDIEKVTVEVAKKTAKSEKNAEHKQDMTKKDEKRIRKLKEAIDQANQEVRMKQTACEFSYDEDTNRIAIKVKDKETDEVIREIPAEETLEMLARIREQAGLMMDERR